MFGEKISPDVLTCHAQLGRNTTPDGIRHSYMLRVKYGKRRIGTSLAPETV